METITVSSSEVSDLANVVYEALAAKGATNGTGICAAALVVGRLMAPRTINMEEEIKFVQDLIEWGGSYWTGLDKEAN